jgi:hypothetical protein
MRRRKPSTPPAEPAAAPVAAPPSALGSTPLGSTIVERTKVEEALTGGWPGWLQRAQVHACISQVSHLQHRVLLVAAAVARARRCAGGHGACRAWMQLVWLRTSLWGSACIAAIVACCLTRLLEAMDAYGLSFALPI